MLMINFFNSILLTALIILNLLAMNPESLCQVPAVSAGKVIRYENFLSQYVSARNIDIWIPEGYSQDQKYAVLYMHDGQMLFDSTTNWNHKEWCVDETVSRLLAENKIKPCIVVAIWNKGAARHSEYFPRKPFLSLPSGYRDSLLLFAKRSDGSVIFSGELQSDNYLKFIVKELKPFTDSAFSTLDDRENTFIAGSSMGGLISLYAICEYPGVFGGAACLSTHWTGIFTAENNPIPEAFIDYLKKNLPKPKSHIIYFDYGTETLDTLYEPYQLQVDEIMKVKGYTEKNWETLKFPGEEHSENAWSRRFEIPLKFLLGLPE